MNIFIWIGIFFIIIPLVLMFINMLLEIFGITLLIPLLNFISDETMCNQTCKNIFSYFEINIEQFTFLKLILVSLLFVFFIKTFFVTYLIYKQNQTILNLLSSFAKKGYFSNNNT